MRLTLLLPTHCEGSKECANKIQLFQVSSYSLSFACSDEAHFQSLLPSQWQSWKRTLYPHDHHRGFLTPPLSNSCMYSWEWSTFKRDFFSASLVPCSHTWTSYVELEQLEWLLLQQPISSTVSHSFGTTHCANCPISGSECLGYASGCMPTADCCVAGRTCSLGASSQRSSRLLLCHWQGTFCLLFRHQAFPLYFGWLPFHCLHEPQAADLLYGMSIGSVEDTVGPPSLGCDPN
jgi:hypothetical protein